MNVASKIKKKIQYETTMCKEVGCYVAFLQFLKDFLFFKFPKMSMHLEYKIQTTVKEKVKVDIEGVIVKWRNESLHDERMSNFNNCIWTFWAQGWDCAPEMVQICNNSLKVFGGGYSVVNLDLSNYSEYVDIPQHALTLFQEGKISIVNFSDILRVCLLSQNGGVWIDATVLLTKKLPIDIKNYTFFTVKHRAFKEDEHICKGLWSTFFMGSNKNGKMCSFLRDAFEAYLSSHDRFGSYLLIDCFMALGYEEIPALKQEVDKIPDNNMGVFCLCPLLERKYSKEAAHILCEDNYIHKMTYKSAYDEQLCIHTRSLMSEIN